MKTIKQILMKRDNMTEEEAEDIIACAVEDLNERLMKGDSTVYDICEEYFGLEPDYIMELIP